MKRPDLRHPPNEDLLRYGDGELSARSARKVRKHLEACWECRAELEEIQESINHCVSYRKSVLQRHLPPPPAPWIDIYRGFASIDASTEPEFFSEERDSTRRPGRATANLLRWPAGRIPRWAIATAAVAAVCALVYRFEQTPAVEAAALLKNAVAAAKTRPFKAHRIEIRTRSHRFTRWTGAHSEAVSDAADRDALNSLRALFVAANYSWQDPLSASAYQAWRAGLPDKRDGVVVQPQNYLVRTSTSNGELAAATLTLRRQDLHPVEERLEFRNQEWVEMTEVEEAAPEASQARIVAPEPAKRAEPVPEYVAKVTPTPAPMPEPATIGDELHVLMALHQVGADLGDPIEVSRKGSNVLVSGIGIAPERRREINAALNAQPHVLVQFTDSTPPPAVEPEKPVTSDRPATAAYGDLQSRLARQMGGRAFFDQLGGEVLDLTESMMSRAYALRRLAERFPAPVESQLSPGDLQLLNRLRMEHASSIRKQAATIARDLRPLLVAKGSHPAPGAPPSSDRPWQAATEELFQSARSVEELSAVLFGAAPGESADDQLPARLSSSLDQLRARADAYDRLTAQPERSRE